MIAEEVQLDPRPIRIPPRLKPNDAVELNGVFTPDLKEFFFARRRPTDVTQLFWRITRE